MEFSLPLPSQIAQDGVIARQWASFSQRFHYHRNSSSSQDLCVKATSVLLFAAIQEVETLCESLKMFDMDFLKLNSILEAVEQICLPRFMLLFERFRYFILEHDSSESLSEFVSILRKQGEMCEFGMVKDSIMTSTLVNGLNDENFKQSLQNNSGLCFDDAVTMCNVSTSSSTNTDFHDLTGADSKKPRSHKRKASKGKPSTSSRAAKSMYMIPVYESMNDDADADEHIVNTVINSTSTGTKAKNPAKPKKAKKADPLGPKFLCFMCDNEYANRKSFRRHIANKHGDCKTYFCMHCKETFENRTECITHCKGHNANPLAAVQARNWKETMSSEYLCWYCEEVFTSLPDYKKHSLTHSAVRVFSCDLCQKKNHTISRMIGHVKGHLSPKHKCEICANCFGRAELLAAHMQTHAAHPVHQCLVCNKGFVSADRLQGHMRTHSGEKRFTCELCGKSFSQKMSFDYHKRWHAGEKPYECDVCGRRTRSFGDLRKHKRMHSDKRPYVCEVCGKSFRFISNLNRHRKGHSGKRSFACDVCGRTFIYGEGLRDHIKAGRCPGRKNEGEGKSLGKTPRARSAHVPHPHQQQLETDCNPVNYSTSHHASEVLINEYGPAWQYMLSRNSETEAAGSLVVVPPYY